jgi:nucleoside-diphosphate-sugar epimerase
MKEQKVIVTGGSGFIGTNMVEYLIENGYKVVNFDRLPPRDSTYLSSWLNIDICNLDELMKASISFMPDYIIHLAARTDLNEQIRLEGYDVNMKGVENIMKVAVSVKSVKRIIVASSMLVCKLGYIPSHDIDYAPSTLYGESKVITEKITRSYPIDWVIIRPTSIWGPWFGEPYRNFFELVLSGHYINLNRSKSSTKTYGFVKNAVYQIHSIMRSEEEWVKNSMFYIGDTPPININDWAKLIRAVAGLKPVLTVNASFLKVIALVGDVLMKLSIPFPLTSFRYRNMTTNNVVKAIEKTYTIAPNPPYVNLDEAIRATIKWIKTKR